MKIIKVSNVLQFIFLLSSVLLLFRGQTTIINYSGLLYLAMIFSSFCSFFVSGKKIKIRLPYMILFLLYSVISYYWSADQGSATIYISLYITMIFITFYDIDTDYWNKLFVWIYRLSVVVLISIILEMINPPGFIAVFGRFMLRPGEALGNAYSGEFTGILGGNQHAGVALIMGIAAILAKAYSKNEILLKEKIMVFAFVVGIFLTGKRSLSLLGLALVFLYYLCKNTANKYIKIFIVGFILAVLGFILMEMVPAIREFFFTFFQGETEDDMLSGRGAFWDYCWIMYKERKLAGYGLGSFNKIFYQKTHYLFKGEPWSYGAHDIFLQIMAELGTIGIVLFAVQNIISLKKAIGFIKKKDELTEEANTIKFFSLCIVVFSLLYGIVGMVIYSTSELVIYILALIGIEQNTKELYKKNEKK